MGLRAKSALALCACMAIVLSLAAIAGWRAVTAIEENLGTAFVRNQTQLNKQRILTPVLRELALSQQLAHSEVTRRWLLDEKNAEKKALFFAEANNYQKAFADHSYSVASAISRNYYFNDNHTPQSTSPRYALNPKLKHDAWFFNTMKDSRAFNINVDPDLRLKLTKVWFNVVVKDGARNIGQAGTGLDLTSFLKRFISTHEAGVTPIVLNQKGDIQAHPDRKLIDYSSVNNKGAKHSNIKRLLAQPEDVVKVASAMKRAEIKPDEIQVFHAELNGQDQLFADSFIPELQWHVLTAVDLKAARVIDNKLWMPALLGTFALLTLLIGAISVTANRILLVPLIKLTNSVRAMSKGNYDVELPPASHDELGELTRAFGTMAAQVRSHTAELEDRVLERTRELTQINGRMTQANKKISDSIQYASLIQNAILPDGNMTQSLVGKHFVLWRPRDVVGGDFYIYREDENGCLLGVIDCAGHGVPGAFMTMIAHSALDAAIDKCGLDDPARLLTYIDSHVRAMLHSSIEYSNVATIMDAGLAFLDSKRDKVTFAGAKISLYSCDGENVDETKGDRFVIADKRTPTFTNKTLSMDADKTFYMTTDGMLDQAGGAKGFSFGNTRFVQMLQRHAARPMTEQKAAFEEELAAYQGALQQRDDITILSFRGV